MTQSHPKCYKFGLPVSSFRSTLMILRHNRTLKRMQQLKLNQQKSSVETKKPRVVKEKKKNLRLKFQM